MVSEHEAKQPANDNIVLGRAAEHEIQYQSNDVEALQIEDIVPNPGKGYAFRQLARPTPKQGLERRLIIKMDLLIVPMLALIYFVTYLDRNSFGNGKVLGMSKDLGLSSQLYTNCSQLFYVGYMLFMVPGNIILRTISPKIIISISIVSFGVLVCAMSAAQNYSAVLALRILIGAAQAFTQGIGVYASLWYTRTELATRGALYFSPAILSGAFSGLIAYAIGNNLTEKATGRAPWRWLYIIEGSLGIFIGLAVLVLLPNFPDKIRKGKTWLFTKDEVNLAIQRSSTFNTLGSKFELSQVLVAVKDPKTWAFAAVNGGIALPLSTFGVFLPTFINDFGYTALDAQLFSVIPYACAFIMLPIIAMISDRLNSKAPFIIFGLCLACIGYFMLLFANPTVVQMIAVCFITSGLYPAVILNLTWLGINIGGFTKRATTWGWVEVVSQAVSIGGINAYNTGAPRYTQGHAVALALLGFSLLNAIGLWVWMAHCNKKKDLILADLAARGAVHDHADRSLEEEFDYHINFRYTI